MKDLQKNESRDLAFAIAKILDDKKAENVEVYNVAHLSSVADYFVMATASNTTLVKALADFVEENLVKVGIRNLRRDGAQEWIVLDYNFVIVHIFTPDVKTFYHLDKLWNDGKNVYNLQDIQKLIEKEEKLEEKAKIKKEEKSKQNKEKVKVKDKKEDKKVKNN